MNVLIACESSGEVRRQFRALGHNAWSCDLLPADDGSPHHIQGDVLEALGRLTKYGFLRGHPKLPNKWDLLIAHPPCTYLCNSGVRWLWGHATKNILVRDEARFEKVRAASLFFCALLNSGIPKIAIENPIPHKHAALPPYSQIIQPWMFGHPETKATCLWLKGLPLLVPTRNVREVMLRRPTAKRNRIHNLPPGPDRWKQRSKTFTGIARAMAQQWGGHEK
jgi:hypothetical protein